jgi:transcriptional regulator with XRE-family HTH domain
MEVQSLPSETVPRRDKEERRLRRMLREMREERGLSQGDLAARLGKSQSYVSKLESGDRNISFLEVRDFCRALRVPFVDFTRRYEGDMTSP